MRFGDISGNDNIKKALAGMVDSGHVPHAIMFHEDDGGGAMPLCLAFLQYLFCRDKNGGDSCAACSQCSKISKLIHSDVHFTFPVATGGKISKAEYAVSEAYLPEWRDLVRTNPLFTEEDFLAASGIAGKTTSIYVAEAESIINMLSLNSVEGGYRAIVIYLPEKLNANAANRLLKSIEEPYDRTVFIMITHSPEDVLLTIRSRCQLIRVTPRRKAMSEEVSQAETLFRSLMDSLAVRDMSTALSLSEEMASLPSREIASSFCIFATEALRWIFLIQQGLTALSGLDQARVQYYSSIAGACKKSFPRLAMGHFDRARMLVERNVNQKIVFCDLVDKLMLIF